MAEISWIKLRTDMFDDNKIKIIQSMPDGDSLLVIWVRLITLAGHTNDNGYVYLNENLPFTEEMLATVFGKTVQMIKYALGTFEQMHMIEVDSRGIYLVNFSKHQSVDKMSDIREYNRLKQKESRHRRKMMLENSVNDMSMTVNANVNLDKDIDKDIDKDNKKHIVQQVDTIWARYPLKKGKATAIKKIPKLIEQYGYEQLIRCIERYELGLQKETWRKPQNGSTFFNSGYVDYLDENYQEGVRANGNGYTGTNTENSEPLRDEFEEYAKRHGIQ